jgi:hypothetical protein
MRVSQIAQHRVSRVIYPRSNADRACVDDTPPSEGWNGEVAAVYVRNSRPVQRGNNRSHWQLDLASYLLGMSYAVKLYDEQGVSGARLTGRNVATQMIADLKAGVVTCVAVAELSRLTRDSRGYDARYVGESLVRHGHGKLITYDKVYDLREADDWNEYEGLVTAAAWQARELTRSLSSGLAKGLEFGPLFRGACKLGYRRVELRNAEGCVELDRYRRMRTVVEKDDRVAQVMMELARQFEEQPDLTAVCRAMNRGGWHAPWKPITGGYVWRSDRLRCVLNDSLYEGVWRFNFGAAAPNFWAQVARPRSEDGVGFDPVAAEHEVPQLAWYSSTQMQRWRSKFLGRPASFTRGAHVHQFAGIVACAGCHEMLVKNGKNGYRCRNDGRGCSREFTVTEKLTLQAIEAAIHEAMTQRTRIVTMINAAAAEYDVASIENRLNEVEDRQRFLANNWTDQHPTICDWVLEEERALACEQSRLEAELQRARLELRLADGIAAAVPQLVANPVATLRQLGLAHQGFFVRALFRVIELEGTGHGNGRNVRVVRWELRANCQDQTVAV